MERKRYPRVEAGTGELDEIAGRRKEEGQEEQQTAREERRQAREGRRVGTRNVLRWRYAVAVID
jgi:hypothetical protein